MKFNISIEVTVAKIQSELTYYLNFWHKCRCSVKIDPNCKCRWLPPVTAYSTPLTTMDKTRARSDMLYPYLKIKLTEPLLINSPDNYSPPHILKLYVYIFIY